MKSLPTEDDLKNGFSDFLELALDLLQRCEKNNKFLKAAAVNAQIALELFLKYYFKKIGKENEIRRKKNNILLNDYTEFSQVLGYFYSTQKWTYGEKKELVRLLEARNSIVHRAQDSNWDEELAIIIARVFFFIHCTSWMKLGESVLFNNYVPHPIAKVKVWRKGAESYAESIADMMGTQYHRCVSCGAMALLSGDDMVLDESTSAFDDMICLCCLSSINISREARLLECHQCSEKSYWVDALNEQGHQLYPGKCIECKTNTWVRKCRNCKYFYHPSVTDEVYKDGEHFCSDNCEIMYPKVRSE